MRLYAPVHSILETTTQAPNAGLLAFLTCLLVFLIIICLAHNRPYTACLLAGLLLLAQIVLRSFTLSECFSGLMLGLISILFNLDLFYYIYLTVFVAYLVAGLFLFFYWGNLGVMGIFLVAEYILGFFFIFSIAALYLNLKFNTALSIVICELFLADDFAFINCINFDILSILGTTVVGVLTLIVLTFGVEYMLREALAYSVIATLILFSANIVWFIISYSFGLMTIFWELSGVFSLLLVDMYYSRVRTTQAVSRTFAIGRFSDFWMFLASVEIFVLCKSDSVATLLSLLPECQFELSVVAGYLFDVTSSTVIIFSIFVAASCKCAQFLLFVWLPDAMEAPTPASALIHSSTLVVMGIFLILRFSSVLHTSMTVLYIMSAFGSLTVAYGAIFSIQTSDLKKAVAYSTISQIGYLFCGCACLALKETLFYLLVHALCKAMLFIFVGYIVHMFGGTTSLRKMGGVFYIIPDVGIYMFILCIILAGAPYTLGFFAKELIINHLLSGTSPLYFFVLSCWFIAFLCTPVYLYRICILPIFGRPRASRRVFRNISPLQINFVFKEQDANMTDGSDQLFKFSSQVQRWVIQNRLITYLHFFIIVLILFCGEFLVFLLTGFFGSSTQLLTAATNNIHSVATISLYLNSFYLLRNVQLLIIVLFLTITLYMMFINNQTFFSIILHCFWIILLIVVLLFLIAESLGLLWVFTHFCFSAVLL